MTALAEWRRRDCQSLSGASWSAAALCALLERLATDSITEGHLVEIVETRIESDAEFVVLFRAPWLAGVAAVRCDRHRALDPDLYPCDRDQDGSPEPISYGRSVADFAIGEPLDDSALAQADQQGVQWLVL